MDQLKTILRQVVKQRFWIAVVVAAILPLGLYLGLSGSINADTDKKAADIKGALKGANEYANGFVPNSQYTNLVTQQTGVLKGEVDKTWKTLYDRQEPLMIWPETVVDKFPVWGRTWPKGVDNNLVQQAIDDYVVAFPEQVDRIYNLCHPFDFKEGTGVVSAPPKELLLMAPEFDYRVQPTLKQIWDAQQRLWLQGALLDVVAKVNEEAKATDWDSAPIKQIFALDVASMTAQDQQAATAKDNKLANSKDIVADGTPVVVDATKNATGATGGSMDMRLAGGGGGNKASANQDLYSVEAAGGQYRLYPVSLGVLMEQSKIQDLLAALKTSPMVIQVRELDVQRPTAHVTKPSTNGTNQFANMAGMDGGRGGFAPAIFNQTAYPTGANAYRPTNAPNANDPRMAAPAFGTLGSMAYTSAPVKEVRKGISLRGAPGAEKAKKAEAAAKAEAEAAAKVEPPNPYYDIVQVTIYGQARFYSKPPEAPATTTTTESATKAEPAGSTPLTVTPKASTTPETVTKPSADESKVESSADDAKPSAKAQGDNDATPGDDKPMEKDDAKGNDKETHKKPDMDEGGDFRVRRDARSRSQSQAVVEGRRRQCFEKVRTSGCLDVLRLARQNSPPCKGGVGGVSSCFTGYRPQTSPPPNPPFAKGGNVMQSSWDITTR